MRHSGQTTRLIDEAIQHLFTTGQLFLLKKQCLNRASSIVPEYCKVFIDPDHKNSNQVQQDFIYRLMKRLEFEHLGHYEVKVISRDFIFIVVN